MHFALICLYLFYFISTLFSITTSFSAICRMCFLSKFISVHNYTLSSVHKERPIVKDSLNSCIPSPCGPNSQCRVSNANEQPVCSCLPNYIGRAPNCRPECTSNSECRSNQACVNRRCKDSCQGSCGSFTTCIVNNHRPICRCLPGYTGDPFAECSPQSKNIFNV